MNAAGPPSSFNSRLAAGIVAGDLRCFRECQHRHAAFGEMPFCHGRVREQVRFVVANDFRGINTAGVGFAKNRGGEQQLEGRAEAKAVVMPMAQCAAGSRIEGQTRRAVHPRRFQCRPGTFRQWNGRVVARRRAAPLAMSRRPALKTRSASRRFSFVIFISRFFLFFARRASALIFLQAEAMRKIREKYVCKMAKPKRPF